MQIATYQVLKVKLLYFIGLIQRQVLFIGPQGLYTGRGNEKLGEIHAVKLIFANIMHYYFKSRLY